MDFGGWASVEAPCGDRRWIAVRDSRVPAIGFKTVHDIHIWTRRNIEYRADVEDAWAQPFETLGWGHGDCEDISILERALLIAAGYPSNLMWLVLVYDKLAHVDHALLVYDRFLIDSRTDRIGYAAKAKDYEPVIAFSDGRAVTFGRKR
jgi:predicted transglutaminase-like cysteine proteinase